MRALKALDSPGSKALLRLLATSSKINWRGQIGLAYLIHLSSDRRRQRNRGIYMYDFTASRCMSEGNADLAKQFTCIVATMAGLNLPTASKSELVDAFVETVKALRSDCDNRRIRSSEFLDQARELINDRADWLDDFASARVSFGSWQTHKA